MINTTENGFDIITENEVFTLVCDNALIARLENNVTENYLITQLGNLTP